MPVQAFTICEVHQFRELIQLIKWHVQQQQKKLNLQKPEKKKESRRTKHPNKESRRGRRKKKEK